MNEPITVRIVIFPGASATSVAGACDIFGSVANLDAFFGPGMKPGPPFTTEIVAARAGLVECASGVTLRAARALPPDPADIILVPPFMIPPQAALQVATPAMVRWLRQQRDEGALIGSICSGSLLLAAAGLLDGIEATTHWTYESFFADHFPSVHLAPRKVLVDAGITHGVITAGGGSSWHDLVLFFVARFAGPEYAEQIARVFLLEWDTHGQSALAGLRTQRPQNDPAIRRAQDALRAALEDDTALAAAERASGLPRRTYGRRFRQATGFPPRAYLQLLRIERARELLQTTTYPADEIAAQVGYEDPVTFRRTFRRLVGLTPGEYRRRFRRPLPA